MREKLVKIAFIFIIKNKLKSRFDYSLGGIVKVGSILFIFFLLNNLILTLNRVVPFEKLSELLHKHDISLT